MHVVVQKFGGTSVATRDMRLRAAAHVESAISDGNRVVVVVSAMGRKGDPYATDTLLGIPDEESVVSARDLDLLMTCGEQISAVVFAGLLRSRGHDVAVLTGGQAGIITTNQFGSSRIVDIDPSRVNEELSLGRIVVVMGFQGITSDGEVTTLGRGGSDTTATALGVALDADVVDIFTDVDGIMTADPRIVSDAKRLHQVTYNEICNLAYQGAKVIHPRAVEIAMQKNIPIRVRSTLTTDPGTLVTSAAQILESHHVLEKPVTGITQTANVTQIELTGDSIDKPSVFAAMAEHGISVDFISVGPSRVQYTVADSDAKLTVRVLSQLGQNPSVLPGCAKIAAVGAGIAGVPGIMAQIVDALEKEGIEILQSADSHTTIWCLIRREQMERAVRALHEAFRLAD